MLQVPGELDKGNADRRLPIAPEFAIFLLETLEAARAADDAEVRASQGTSAEWGRWDSNPGPTD